VERYICIHGHFYQPPRENPWLEALESQDSAYPYHDWNERVTAECYAPNFAARLLGEQGHISEIVNNYAKISFNFGPTLLAWVESNAPDVYEAILEADQQSRKTFSGHGSALAQAYNHMILPLANSRDKHAQVLWGIRDFKHRFRRSPEGMWLPETAVDLETLEVLAELGISFTILAPHQASRVRPTGKKEWQDVSGGRIDPTMPYALHLPSGRAMNIFFYDGPIARAVAFEGLLKSGEDFARRLVGAFSDVRTWPQLVHIATDGETYGHHHRFGDMALAYAIHYIESGKLAQLTNYGEYLEKHPPTYDVEIIENTSWSCSHGIERWRSDCGCNSGMHPDWNQAWRAPLRNALDWLRDTLAPKYEESAAALLKDPWRARDDYIEVALNRSSSSIERFLSRHAIRELSQAEKVTVLKLLELQRHAMLMYTSCGWFFDELSGIETVQVIRYAGWVVQLAEEVLGEAIEPSFLKLLEQAKSNIPDHGDGRRVYEEFVRPARVGLTEVMAHYAISSLFEDYGKQTRVYCFSVDLEDYSSSQAGRAKLAVGRARITSEVTQESSTLSFGVLHFGDHNLNAGVREYQGEKAYQNMVQEVTQAFSTADYPEVIRRLDRHFGMSTYSLRHLFRDEQRKVLDRILESTLAETEAAYRQVYTLHYPLMRFLTDLGHPLPKALRAAAEFILDTDLRRALSSDSPQVERIRELLDLTRGWNVGLDTVGLGHLFKQTLERMADRLARQPEDVTLLRSLVAAVELARSLPFEVNMWKAQNVFYEMLWSNYPGVRRKARKGDNMAEEWVADFTSLGDKLEMSVT
jgi:alpha-amylase/alpha-mannosidase (GH57 family)